MKLNRCPVCHSMFDIMALAQDEATQEVLVKLAKFDTITGVSLLGYLSLFCPAKAQLSAARSLSLVNELDVIAMGNWQRMAVAMELTVQTMQEKKRNNDDVGQFKNHNYLKKVFADIPDNVGVAVAGTPALTGAQRGGSKASKTAGALATLEGLKNE